MVGKIAEDSPYDKYKEESSGTKFSAQLYIAFRGICCNAGSMQPEQEGIAARVQNSEPGHRHSKAARPQVVAQPLVQVSRGAGHTQDDETGDSSDPAFRLSGSRGLQIDPTGWGTRALDHFAHVISIHSADLLVHVQRINLCVAQSDRNGVYGALLDLFLVLGAKGAALRKRMCEIAAPSLSHTMREFFSDNLESGVSATDVLPLSLTSVLSRGLRGTTELVQRVGASGVGTRDPLDEANECLEYGQIDAARSILEAAVLEQPDRAELHNDLLEIYRRTEDFENFREMHQKLSARHNPVADSWELMAASFGVGDRP